MAWFMLIAITALIIVFIGLYNIHSTRYPSTDDTYIQANIVHVAPQVSGFVTQIFVQNHEAVTQGQPLVLIDPRPYQYAVQQADAQLKLAQQRAKRIFPLIKTGRAARAEADQINAQLEEATAALSQAEYDLANTLIKAPQSGVLADLQTRIGDSVTKGYDLFALVEQQEFWVDANFKETQLKRIKPGQTAEINVDMYPDHPFKGIVQSVSPGSGTVFSLLPAENATGNWVKVTQRVPVKIIIINSNLRYPLIAGTSAHATVDTVTAVITDAR
ncbi:MAG: HlyD family secretion protein [Gammaproteobacteria bacterium]|nr:HlyD family secretion protein [Gammaproteobacteria bacterium]